MRVNVWQHLVYIFDVLTLSSLPETDRAQAPLGTVQINDATPIVDLGNPPPIIDAPKRGKAFQCTYPSMRMYENCHGPESRGCWLKSKKKGSSDRFDIDSDYEYEDSIPHGEIRKYQLDVSEMPLDLDGMTMEHGKVFNRTYPGPWIEACWGDWIEVKVTNKLAFNGTSIHFHGIRQLNTTQMDGVNGITQCPIAPGDSFTYKFRAMQYGSSWYHSHYSLQYGDGMLGPMTIYGPATANYDSYEAFPPILMTDWNHRSVFEDWPLMLESGAAAKMTNILLNGQGQYGPSGKSRMKYQITAHEGQKHMLILINTAVDTTFVFSIDGHQLQVIEADFVPIVPYITDHIVVGIGQRYHVIIEAKPFPRSKYDNYWIRTIPARKCSSFSCGPDEKMGILRYNTTADPDNKKDPLSEPFLFDIACRDEPYDKLVPYLQWTVGNPANIDPTSTTKPLADKAFEFVVHMEKSSGAPYIPDKATWRWTMHEAPFRINFSDPTILDLERPQWHKSLNVVTLDNQEGDQWIWLVISAPDDVPSDGERLFIPAAHPMHLHGHDFALLKQSTEKWDPTKTQLNCDDESIQCDNPPRRDVALLPASGYLIIAFKADNPGAWIIHCHIAFHASSGLAMQIIENKHLIRENLKKDKDVIEGTCNKWNEWLENPLNHWDNHNPAHFQDDSGV